MKKEKSIQADIEVLKKMFTNPYFEGEQYSALISAISWGEAMRDASDMLPCKKPHLGWCGIHMAGSCTCGLQDREEMLDLCQPVVAKLLLKIKELEDEISRKNSM